MPTTTKTPKTTTTTEEAMSERVFKAPTREDIFSGALVVARHTNRVPCLLGPTAAGKTYGLMQLAEQHNATLVTVLLGQHTPDEIAGFQLAINDKLVIQMPFWYTEAQTVLDSGKNVWILFDELGLSREETRGALYTFMRDRHLHGHTLNVPPGQEALVFAASNPATFAPPFRSRCLFLSVPSDRDYLSTIAKKSSFVSKIVNIAPIHDDSDPFYSNEGPPSPVVLDASATKALVDLTATAAFWRLNDEARYVILAGLVPYQTLVNVLNNNTIDISALMVDWEELARSLKALPADKMHAMMNNVIATLPQISAEQRVDVILTILDVLYDDLSGQAIQTYFSTTHAQESVAAVSEVDVDLLERRLLERGLLWVETKGKTTVSKGSLLDRIEKMVEQNK